MLIASLEDIDIKTSFNIDDILSFRDIEDKDPKELINDIIKYLFDIHKTISSQTIDTFIIQKTNDYKYCMFSYNGVSTKNMLISHLIDNSYQDNYDEKVCLNHDNYCVICKIDENNNKVLDVDKDELIKIIKSSYDCQALLITPNTMSFYHYHNNPVYNLEGFDVYNSFDFEDKELRIHFDYNDNQINSINKELYDDIFDKWHILKDNTKKPYSSKFILSLHSSNVNISIDEELKNKIINFLRYK